MTTTGFFAAIVAKHPQVEIGSDRPANTCNAWGFGGWSGFATPFKLAGKHYELRNGWAYFRHLPRERVFVVYCVDAEFASQRRVTPKKFLETV